MLDELKKLTVSIPTEELERAKNILKMNILMAMERKEDRIEEIARNQMTYKKLTFMDYCQRIDEVTSDKINKAAKRMLTRQPTMVAMGEAVEKIPDLSLIRSYLTR